jgi:hypothetical protein
VLLVRMRIVYIGSPPTMLVKIAQLRLSDHADSLCRVVVFVWWRSSRELRHIFSGKIRRHASARGGFLELVNFDQS